MTGGQRAAIAAVCTLLLLVLAGVFVHAHTVGDQGYRGYTEGRASFHGTDVVISLARVLSIDAPGRYTLAVGNAHLKVAGPTETLVLGSDVSIGGVYDAPSNTISANWLEHHADGRVAKRALGALGVLLTLLGAVFTLRRDPDGLVLRG